MNSQDIQNLQESYLAVYDDETRENLEFENWVNNLLDEGYDLSSYTWDEMAKIYIDEARAEGVRPYKAGPTQAEVRADAKKSEKAKKDKDKDKEGYGPEDKFKSDWKLRAVPSSTSKRKDGTEETVSQRMNREAPYKTRPFSPLFTKQGSRTASAVTRATEGPGEPQSVTMPRKKSKPSKKIVRRGNQNEAYDLYDVILSHLIDEGYADTYESAEAIMVNMSEEWRESIVEDFPNVLNFPSQGGSRSGDAGTRGLKMIQTPGGQRGYINKHSGGEILPSGTVNKIMGGNLMVKNGTKKNTNSNIA